MMIDLIDRQAAIEAMEQAKEQYFDRRVIIGKMQDIVNNLPSAEPEDKCGECDAWNKYKNYSSVQPEIIRCKDCKHNPKDEWFGCPMSHLSEAQRPETAWCWKAERRIDESD